MQTISPQEVNAYLPKDKWQVDLDEFNEPDLEANAVGQVLGKLSFVYNVDDWRNVEAPALVRQVIAMHMAAWIYARQFGEDTANVNSYASWLLRQAQVLLDAILSGTVVLEEDVIVFDEDQGAAVSGPPIFTTGRVF